MKKSIKEIYIFVFVAFSSLFILGYTVHMFIGGLVNKNTEILLIAITCTIGFIVVSFMAWDIIKQRRKSLH